MSRRRRLAKEVQQAVRQSADVKLKKHSKIRRRTAEQAERAALRLLERYFSGETEDK